MRTRAFCSPIGRSFRAWKHFLPGILIAGSLFQKLGLVEEFLREPCLFRIPCPEHFCLVILIPKRLFGNPTRKFLQKTVQMVLPQVAFS